MPLFRQNLLGLVLQLSCIGVSALSAGIADQRQSGEIHIEASAKQAVPAGRTRIADRHAGWA